MKNDSERRKQHEQMIKIRQEVNSTCSQEQNGNLNMEDRKSDIQFSEDRY